jgi:hypothetical protein
MTVGTYRLEQLIERSELGALYQARADLANTVYLLRVLAVDAASSPLGKAGYRERFLQQASHIATLQHPYILPLLDYGFHGDVPYLVWPNIPLRSLDARLAQSGPVDVLTAGRYLDQIAGALEYAHEHSTLHRSLTASCIFIQLDGRLIVADFGVRRLIELGRQDTERHALSDNSEACAPEQIRGGAVNTQADVYGLGCVLYALLTGRPVFAGAVRGEVATQHLRAPVPPLRLSRSGLPAALDDLLVRALAKEPEQRFAHPGELANAYAQIVSPNNAARVPFVITTAPPSAPLRRPTAGPTAAESAPQSLPAGMRPDGAAPRATPSLFSTTPGRLALVALVILVLGAGSGLLLRAVGGQAAPTGQVTFVDSSSGALGHTDALSIVANGLEAPASGSQYDAWLIDEQSEHIIALGPLTAHGQTYSVNYGGDGGGSGQAGINLLGAGNKLEITLEQGHVKAPVGRVVLSAVFPAKMVIHLGHILVSYPTTPGKIGLLVGVLTQAQALSAQGHALQQAAASHDTVAAACATQGILDIIEGKQGTHYAPLKGQCAAQGITEAGDGFGLLGTAAANGQNGYLANALDHASLAATQPDATSSVRLHAKDVEAAINDVEGWVQTIDSDAVKALNDPTNAALTQEIVTLCDRAYNGVDANGNGRVDPVAGEAGALTAYAYGQMMATLTLTAQR